MNAFAHIVSEDLRAIPVPRFIVEPKDKGIQSEAWRQASFRDDLLFIAPSIKSWGVPNAGKRGFKAQARAKKEGLTAGVFDEHYAAPDSWVAFLEWKDGSNTLDRAQIEWGNAMLDRGFNVACVRTPAFALKLFRQWGAPLIDRVDGL